MRHNAKERGGFRSPAARAAPLCRQDPHGDADQKCAFAARLERVLASQGSQITFGWAVFPSDGENALSLYRAADERLYARKLVRLEQPEASGVVPLGA